MMDALVLAIMGIILTAEVWIFYWALRRATPATVFRDTFILWFDFIAFVLTCFSLFGQIARMSDRKSVV